jgi:hypothetical protein
VTLISGQSLASTDDSLRESHPFEVVGERQDLEPPWINEELRGSCAVCRPNTHALLT